MISVSPISGSLIAKNTLVIQTGFDTAQQLATIDVADPALTSTSLVFGVTQESIADDACGSILITGSYQADTSSFSLNDNIFLGTGGTISVTPGVVPIVIGRVLSAGVAGTISLFSALTGASTVSGPGRERAIILTTNDFRKGVSAPIDVTIGTTPTVPALRFTSVLELVTAFAMMPTDWDSGDVLVVLIMALTTTELTGEDISMKMDYVTVVPESTGLGPGRASTRVTVDHTVTTATGLATGDVHGVMFPISATDATNPIPRGTSPKGLAMEFSLNNVVGVAAIDLIGACILYNALY